jgi:methylated-DNA-[protein]-cysteine S-methyltransferase
VLEALRQVPYGEDVSVERLARMAAGVDPDDETTVRTALAENPVPLVVGDHRVRDGPSAAPPAVEQRLRSVEGL